MAYPSTIDSPDVSMQGTTLFATEDHANQHRTVGSAVIAIENKLGIGSGSAALNQILVGSGIGTAAWGSVWTNAQLGNPTITTGIANGIILGTPVIGTIAVPGTTNALSFSAAIAPHVGTITDTVGTLVVNAQQANIFYSVQGTAAGNRTIGTPQNPTAYQQLTYAFKTSGSANGTLIWSSVFRISQDVGTPTLGTGVGWNYYGWRYNSIDSKYDYIGSSRDLI